MVPASAKRAAEEAHAKRGLPLTKAQGLHHGSCGLVGFILEQTSRDFFWVGEL